MFGFKNNCSYSYIPSYLFKTGSKYKQLTEEYQDLFINFIKDKDLLSKEDKEKVFIGIKHITEYIAAGFFYSVKENYDSKTNQEKVISAIYFRMTKIYGSEQVFKERIEEQIYDTAESAVFYSLGLETYKKRESFKWDPTEGFFKNFIKHASEVVFKSLIYDLMKEFSEVANSDYEGAEQITNDTQSEGILSGKEMIENCGMGWSIPPEIQEKIISYLDEGEDKYINEIQDYLEIIYSGLVKKK